MYYQSGSFPEASVPFQCFSEAMITRIRNGFNCDCLFGGNISRIYSSFCFRSDLFNMSRDIFENVALFVVVRYVLVWPWKEPQKGSQPIPPKNLFCDLNVYLRTLWWPPSHVLWTPFFDPCTYIKQSRQNSRCVSLNIFNFSQNTSTDTLWIVLMIYCALIQKKTSKTTWIYT